MGDSSLIDVVRGAAIGAAAGLLITTTWPLLLVGGFLALGCCVAYALLTREKLEELKNSPEVKRALENKLRGKSLSTLHLSGKVAKVETTHDGKKCVTVEIKAAGHRATHTAKVGANEISDEIYVGASF